MAEDKQCCCGSKMKERSDSEKKLLLNRLKRIEGQIRGIYGMVENDAYCIDILNQALAANAALTALIFPSKSRRVTLASCIVMKGAVIPHFFVSA